MPEALASHRCMVSDVQAAVDFSAAHLGFVLRSSAVPAFAHVIRGICGWC